MDKNKVNWGLAKSAYAPLTVDENGNYTYQTPIMFVGNRQVNCSPSGEIVSVYADGITLLRQPNNTGYGVTVESTSLDEDFSKYALDNDTDSKNVQFEKSEMAEKRFAFIWEWIGDKHHTRHILYDCVANRPELNATTDGDGGSRAAQYQSVNIVASPRVSDGIVKAFSRSDVDQTVYNNWFLAVQDKVGSSDQTVTVIVNDGTTAISGALVVLGDGSQAKTNASGQAVFYKAAGTYDIMVSASGFVADADSVIVAAAAVSKTVSLTAA